MLLSALLLVVQPLHLQAPPEVLREGLAISRVARSGRIPFPTDAVLRQLAEGKWTLPKEGDKLSVGGQERTWTKFSAGADGGINQGPFQGGYACFQLTRAQPEILILEASGHGVAYVNGVPRGGDPYGNGYLKLPIQLEQGSNWLLFGSGRGALRAQLTRPTSPALFNLADATLPDLVAGEPASMDAGLIVLNATAETMSGLRVQVRVASGQRAETELPPIPPLSQYKGAVKLRADALPEGSADVALALVGPGGMLDFQKTSVRVRGPKQSRKVTFVSEIDGSVQYYGLVPAQTPGESKALILTPHGAGVEGIGQADAFGPKDWAYIVAPTNRRPFGFDWEDWGEEDAMEVLRHAQRTFKTDPAQTYLTGHSMGGHGTWHLGAVFPNDFAAIGPSAGWVSFFSYAGAPRQEPRDSVEALFFRAMNNSDTLALKKNLLHTKVYILHGDADDNVPVREARTMKEQLSAIGSDFQYHEEPGAGHWWDNDPAPGAACVDWPPMMKLFQETRIPANKSVDKVSYLTFDPGRSGLCRWVRIESQEVPLAVSMVDLERRPGRVVGKTENVRQLTLLPDAVDWNARIFVAELDGQTAPATLTGSTDRALTFQKVDGKWTWAGAADVVAPQSKRHLFKSAFRNGAWLVYGTQGAKAEQEWTFAKARYDAEQFAYRGNGAFRVVSDAQAIAWLDQASAEEKKAKNFVIYGNSGVNAAFGRLLRDEPVQVEPGRFQVGKKSLKSAGLGCLFLRPLTKNGPAMVGVVGGTSLGGMKLTDRMPYFVSGVQYPDWCVFDSRSLESGMDGVLGAGFFGDDWQVLENQSGWRTEK